MNNKELLWEEIRNCSWCRGSGLLCMPEDYVKECPGCIDDLMRGGEPHCEKFKRCPKCGPIRDQVKVEWLEEE